MNSVDPTTSTLIAKLKASDQAGWQRLIDLYEPLISAWCRRYGLRESDIADLVQDVFSVVSRKVRDYESRSGSTFRGWLWTITRNKLNDRYRKAKDEIQAAGGTEAQNRMSAIPEQLLDQSDLHLRQATDRLIKRGLELVRSEFEERTWKIFWRAAVEGEPTGEIAAEFGISANAVRQAKSRILRRLREELGDGPN